MTAARAAALGMEYLTRQPRPGTIPPGKTVVHNHVYPVARRPGTRGSRIWLADAADPQLVACDCGWAPELGGHCRVLGPAEEAAAAGAGGR